MNQNARSGSGTFLKSPESVDTATETADPTEQARTALLNAKSKQDCRVVMTSLKQEAENLTVQINTATTRLAKAQKQNWS